MQVSRVDGAAISVHAAPAKLVALVGVSNGAGETTAMRIHEYCPAVYVLHMYQLRRLSPSELGTSNQASYLGSSCAR